jgi:hypothetical protein
MDLLLIAGLGAFGYFMTEETPLPPPPPKGPRPQTTTAILSPLKDVFDANPPIEDVISRDPSTKTTTNGVVSSYSDVRAQQPFFSSLKKQHTNPALSQRRLDLYTGNLENSPTGTWKRKSEQETMFAPVQQEVTFSGTAGNPVTYNLMSSRSQSQVTGRQHNVSPVERRTIGPGVGIGYGADVGQHGFHYGSMRILPKNLNEHRLNNLPGRSNHGGVYVTKQPIAQCMAQKGPPKVFDIDRRPPEPTKFFTNARMHRSPFPRYMGCKVSGSESYVGIAGHQVEASLPDGADGDWVRYKNDNNQGLPLTNVAKERDQVGAYKHMHYDPARLHMQQREMTGVTTNLSGGVVMKRHGAPREYAMQPTKRMLHGIDTHMGSSSTPLPNALAGIAGHYVPTSTERPYDMPTGTLREQMHPEMEPGIAGPAATAPGPTRQGGLKYVEREVKNHMVEDHLFAPERVRSYCFSNIGEDGCVDLNQVAALREHKGPNRVMSHADSHILRSNRVEHLGTSDSMFNKLPIENCRVNELGLAKAQLQSNPLALSIT